MYIISLIPARSGSKGIKDKNIKEYKGEPLLCHSINISKESKYIKETIVTTDSEIYKEISEKNGAICPFLRPSEISQDLSTDYEFIKHYLEWMKSNNSIVPELIVQLRPTYPNRKIEILDDCIEIMMNNKDYTSLRTVVPTDKSPFKMYTTDINTNKLIPLFEKINDINEPYNLARQQLPKTYLHNGYIDIIRTSSFYQYDSITGPIIYPYIMDKSETDDIDYIEEWIKSENK